MNKTLSNLIRAHYRDLQGYVSAGMESDKSAQKIFMNANENPFELPGLEGLNRYPEPQPQKLRAAYAGLYDAGSDQIVMTRGADEAISLLVKVFCEPHRDAVVLCPPTFGIYRVDADAAPADVVNVPLMEQDGTFALDVEGIIEAAKADHVKLVFLCSPNNPTGTSFDEGDMRRICREAEGDAAVIIDETYIEFADAEGVTSALSDHPNLIILRTLSKSFSLAGMRMGSMLCADTDFIDLMYRKALETYPLPLASVEAALKVAQADVQKTARDNIQTILVERDRMHVALEGHDLVQHIYPSDANFLLVKMSRAHEFSEYCAQNDVILRDFSADPLTKDCLRISVGLPEHNDLLIGLLNKFGKM